MWPGDRPPGADVLKSPVKCEAAVGQERPLGKPGGLFLCPPFRMKRSRPRRHIDVGRALLSRSRWPGYSAAKEIVDRSYSPVPMAPSEKILCLAIQSNDS